MLTSIMVHIDLVPDDRTMVQPQLDIGELNSGGKRTNLNYNMPTHEIPFTI
jgi:hypothetical protein